MCSAEHIAIIGGGIPLYVRGSADQLLIHGNAFGPGITLDGVRETDALEINLQQLPARIASSAGL